MSKSLGKKILVWMLLSVNLSLAFMFGLVYPIGLVPIPLLIVFIYFLLKSFKKTYNLRISREFFYIWIMLTVNLLFSFLIGATIPYMESYIITRFNMALVMIPLLILLNYVVLDRFQYYITENLSKNDQIQQSKKKKSEQNGSSEKPVIEFEDRNYIFSVKSIAILAIGAPISSYLIYLFFNAPMNYWLHEIVVKQTVFFLNLLFNMGAKSVYDPSGYYHWSFVIPGRGEIFFETFCTGVQAICVFAGIIIFTPHSQDPTAKSDIVWRKTKSLVVSSVIFYVVNIIRMLIQLYLFYLGYAWVDIHYSISAASSFIAAIIVLLMHKWIPEFIISIIYTGTLINEGIKKRRKETIKLSVQEDNTIDTYLIMKMLGLKKNNFKRELNEWANYYGYRIKDNYIEIPREKVNEFIASIESKEPFEEWKKSNQDNINKSSEVKER